MQLTIVEEHSVGNNVVATEAPANQDERDRKILAYVLGQEWTECLDDIRTREVEWAKYERAYRRKYSMEDKQRDSERSKYVSSLSRYITDSNTEELLDAVFGAGRWFDLVDDFKDPERLDIEALAQALYEDSCREHNQVALEQTALLGRMLGTGIIEINVAKGRGYTPMQQPGPSGTVLQGVYEEELVQVKMNPIHPRHLRIPTGATSLSSASWVGVETPQPLELYKRKVQTGVFKDAYEGRDPQMSMEDQTTRQDIVDELPETSNRWLHLRWYGLIPKNILNPNTEDTELVESMVVIANREAVLFAGENPFYCKVRPIGVYRPRVFPGRFWGCGDIETVIEDQAAADRHFRTHEDALAYTAYPVTGMRATGVPKNFQLKVKPGANILFNGIPSETFQKLDFGQPQTISLQTSQAVLEAAKMVSGVVGAGGDVAGMSDIKAGVVSQALGPIRRRVKNQVRHFQNSFLVDCLRCVAYLYMQFDPKNWPSVDMKFNVIGTSSLVEREVEAQRIASVMATVGPESPVQPLLIAQIIRLSGLQTKEQVVQQLEQFAKELAEKQANDDTAKAGREIALRKEAALAQDMEASATLKIAQAKKAITEMEYIEPKIKAELLAALGRNTDSKTPDDIEFEQRIRMAETVLKSMEVDERAKDRQSNERITLAQMEAKNRREGGTQTAEDALSDVLNHGVLQP